MVEALQSLPSWELPEPLQEKVQDRQEAGTEGLAHGKKDSHRTNLRPQLARLLARGLQLHPAR